ncbi:MAG: RNA polymerase sigma factor [Saprospiraceae bacterium]
MQNEYKRIVDKYNGILYKIARSYTSEEADFKDLYQEILIQLWKSFDNFQGKAKLSTWIYRVALNTALTFQRNRKRQPKSEQFESVNISLVDHSVADIARVKERESQIELLYQCIYQLKKDQRAIILLYLDGRKYDEIAEITGLKANHIGVKISRIKQQLQKIMAEKNS